MAKSINDVWESMHRIAELIGPNGISQKRREKIIGIARRYTANMRQIMVRDADDALKALPTDQYHSFGECYDTVDSVYNNDRVFSRQEYMKH